MTKLTGKALQAAVRKAVANVTISDIHTHLFPPSHGGLLLWGVDELLTYHYLVSELFMVAPASLTPRDFYNLPKAQQADLVWKHLFVERTPISEATRGVLLTLQELGLDAGRRDLTAARRFFAKQKIDRYLPAVLKGAGLDYAVMTNDPFNAEEATYWRESRPVPPQLRTALRIDTLILDFGAAAAQMAPQGYDAQCATSRAHSEARRFLADWAKVLRPMYMAASLPNTFRYGDMPGAAPAEVINKVVLPAARELGLPVAFMIGVKRQVNPALLLAGDAAGVADVQAVQNLAKANPDVKFLITLISRVNQHELCVTARKFPNLHVFGCWWFCNQTSIIQEMTRMRLEMLGTAFTAQHSDSRVLDQLLYKWAEARRIVADVLVEKYAALASTGWSPTTAEIARDARRLLGGSFEEFLAK